MIILATSDKGGTGRSVTGCNVAYRRAVQGDDVAYLDFDFGSPTAGAVFEIPYCERGVKSRGLHSYLQSGDGEVTEINVAVNSTRDGVRDMPANSGRLVLYPGDEGGGEFGRSQNLISRCIRLFQNLEQQYTISIVDLSAGRSYALELALEVTAHAEMQAVASRWLVFHRWTRQHLIAASGLVHGERGMLKTGKACGHDEAELGNSIRFVRTAKVGLDTPQPGVVTPTQAAWFMETDKNLKTIARDLELGETVLLGEVPLDPVLQWREQVITDIDVRRGTANKATVEAFDLLAKRLSDDPVWEA